MTFQPGRPKVGRPLEKVIQQQIVSLFRLAGGVVRSNSQYRASAVSLGFPDLHVSFPRARTWLWWETKRPKVAGFRIFEPDTWVPEPLRPEQELFRLDCCATNQPHFWGGMREAEHALIALGLAHRAGNRFTLIPSGLAS